MYIEQCMQYDHTPTAFFMSKTNKKALLTDT